MRNNSPLALEFGLLRSNSNTHPLRPSSPWTAITRATAAVETFQRISVLLMLLLYTALFTGSVAAAFYRDTLSVELDTPPGELAVLLLCYGVLAAALAIIFLIGLFWNRGMGGWFYNLILICLCLTSCCTWQMTIPLLIFWIKHKDDI